LTRVFIKIKDRFDGFFVIFPESTPSIDDSGIKNVGRLVPDVPFVDLEYRSQNLMVVV
jgi:hypothetical protein